MKLSEAIREGSRLSLQAFGGLGEGGKTCALGAAGEWVYFVGEATWGGCPAAEWTQLPMVIAKVDILPCGCDEARGSDYGLCGYDVNNVAAVIAHLNDTHKWSREAIAEWVEVVENKLETARAAPSATPCAATVEPETKPEVCKV